MRRLVRCLFNAAALLSLVLCVAFVLFDFAFSNGRHPDVSLYSGHRISPNPHRGETSWQWALRRDLEIEYYVVTGPNTRSPAWQDPPVSQNWNISFVHALIGNGPMIVYSLPLFPNAHPVRRSEMIGIVWVAYISYGYLALVLAILPAVATFIFIRRRLKNHPDGFCRFCGYDLRATPDRCPECGTVPPKKEPIQK
jgi:hypothetical protein